MRYGMTRPSMVQFGCVGARCFRVGTACGGAGMTRASNVAQAAQCRVFLRSMRCLRPLRIFSDQQHTSRRAGLSGLRAGCARCRIPIGVGVSAKALSSVLLARSLDYAGVGFSPTLEPSQ